MVVWCGKGGEVVGFLGPVGRVGLRGVLWGEEVRVAWERGRCFWGGIVKPECGWKRDVDLLRRLSMGSSMEVEGCLPSLGVRLICCQWLARVEVEGME